MKRLRMHLLGGFRVTVDDRPITEFEADTARALLAYLALNSAHPHRRDYIAQLLWAAQPRESALVNLRTALNRVRHALSDKDTDLPIILAGRQHIQLNPEVAVWVDIREIERLLAQIQEHAHRHVLGCPWCLARMAKIAGLYQGELFSNVSVNSLPFEEWQTARREEAHHRIVHVLATLAQHHYAWGAYAESERYARDVLALEPWNEEAHQQLMRALFASGKRSAALAQYMACCVHIRKDLGVEPSVETTALYQAISATPRHKITASTLVPNNLPIPTTPFFGREAELDLLLERVVNPANRLTTLVGEAGAGKTRLALAAAHALLGSFVHGVWWVSLADLGATPNARQTQSRITTQIALALGLAPAQDTDAVGQLVKYMRDKELLLVLDACEHLIDGTGFVPDLLQEAPNLALLVTSRQALNLRSEYVFALERLPLPEADDGPHEYTSNAAQIFAERANRNPDGFSEARLHNLPEPLTSFVGRGHELATLTRLLGTTRLLTLIGPGGVGKTRLSLALARAVREQFSAGVWLVDLAPLADPNLILATLAIVFGVREEPDGQLLKRLVSFLSDKLLLLVLDNCEHLIDSCAQLAQQLLAGCPQLTILASSRESLRVVGETLFQVPALRVPNPRRLGALDEVSRYEAVQLFVERARLVNPSFELTEANAAGIAQICVQLDGIPLAIKMAAAWLRLLTVGQIVARLGERFRLLTGGSRAVLPRHQTLHALIDWSYNLLSTQERVLLSDLAVFAGGWTLEAAEAVGMSEVTSDVLGTLTHLVNKSMVQVESGDDVVRYRMLETMRQYALEKLEASGRTDAARRRHTGYYLALAEKAEEHVQWRTTWQSEWLVRLEIEHDNLRAALSFCIERLESQHAMAGKEDSGRSSSFVLPLAEIGVRLAGALGTFWNTCGHLSEGRAWLARILAHSQTIAPAVRAKALNQAGRLAWSQGDDVAAAAYYAEAVALAQEVGDALLIASIRHHQAFLALHKSDHALAEALLHDSLVISREIEAQGQIAENLAAFGGVAAMRGQSERAALLLGAVATWFESTGNVIGPTEQAEHDRYLAAARAQASGESFAAALVAGRAMSLEQALAYAMGEYNQ